MCREGAYDLPAPFVEKSVFVDQFRFSAFWEGAQTGEGVEV